MSDTSFQTQPSICRICTALCPILVETENGRVIRVTGDPDNSLYQGYTCPKGRALTEQHNSTKRLLHTQKRHADGSLQAISGEQAIDEIAVKVQALIAQYGPRSIAMYTGTNSFPYPTSPSMANAWLRGIQSPMFFTSGTVDQPGKHVAMALHGTWEAGEHVFEQADVFMLVGLNPVIAKSTGIPTQNPAQKLKDAVGRGMKLIVVDPRRTETAKKAHIHLPVRPGEDAALLAGMIHIIIEECLYDADFMLHNAEGFDVLAASVQSFTPDYVAARADIAKDSLFAATRTFANGKRGAVVCGTGPNMSPQGTLNEYLALCLNTLCGRWNRAGDQVVRPNVLMPAFTPRAQPNKPVKAFGYGEKLRVKNLTDAACGLPTTALPDEILLEGEGQVKALFVVGGNPMMAWPDQLKTFKALSQLELLVTIDPFMSATAEIADYIIAPKLSLETPGMTLPYELLKFFGPGMGYALPYAQYAERVVEPPAGSDVMEEWEFFYGLAQRMKVPLWYVVFYGWGRHMESPPEFFEIDLHNKPTTEQLYERILQRARVPLEEVKRYPHGHVFDVGDLRVQPRAEDCNWRLQVGVENMMSQLLCLLQREVSPPEHSEERPLYLISRRLNHVVNSSGRELESLNKRRPYNPAYMHSILMQTLQLSEAQRVVIASAYGSIEGIVHADDSLRVDVVSMSHAFGGNPGVNLPVDEHGSNTSRLVSADAECDAITNMPRMSAVPISVRRADGYWGLQ
jgi:anaerobic selenocysteine-containing dehydrogenase